MAEEHNAGHAPMPMADTHQVSVGDALTDTPPLSGFAEKSLHLHEGQRGDEADTAEIHANEKGTTNNNTSTNTNGSKDNDSLTDILGQKQNGLHHKQDEDDGGMPVSAPKDAEALETAFEANSDIAAAAALAEAEAAPPLSFSGKASDPLVTEPYVPFVPDMAASGLDTEEAAPPVVPTSTSTFDNKETAPDPPIEEASKPFEQAVHHQEEVASAAQPELTIEAEPESEPEIKEKEPEAFHNQEVTHSEATSQEPAQTHFEAPSALPAREETIIGPMEVEELPTDSSTDANLPSFNELPASATVQFPDEDEVDQAGGDDTPAFASEPASTTETGTDISTGTNEPSSSAFANLIAQDRVPHAVSETPSDAVGSLSDDSLVAPTDDPVAASSHEPVSYVPASAFEESIPEETTHEEPAHEEHAPAISHIPESERSPAPAPASLPAPTAIPTLKDLSFTLASSPSDVPVASALDLVSDGPEIAAIAALNVDTPPGLKDASPFSSLSAHTPESVTAAAQPEAPVTSESAEPTTTAGDVAGAGAEDDVAVADAAVPDDVSEPHQSETATATTNNDVSLTDSVPSVVPHTEAATSAHEVEQPTTPVQDISANESAPFEGSGSTAADEQTESVEEASNSQDPFSDPTGAEAKVSEAEIQPTSYVDLVSPATETKEESSIFGDLGIPAATSGLAAPAALAEPALEDQDRSAVETPTILESTSSSGWASDVPTPVEQDEVVLAPSTSAFATAETIAAIDAHATLSGGSGFSGLEPSAQEPAGSFFDIVTPAHEKSVEEALLQAASAAPLPSPGTEQRLAQEDALVASKAVVDDATTEEVQDIVDSLEKATEEEEETAQEEEETTPGAPPAIPLPELKEDVQETITALDDVSTPMIDLDAETPGLDEVAPVDQPSVTVEELHQPQTPAIEVSDEDGMPAASQDEDVQEKSTIQDNVEDLTPAADSEAQESRPERPWTPSYSVRSQGPGVEDAEEQPESEVLPGSPEVHPSPSLRAEPEAPKENAEDLPNRPWTPSYSVNNQGAGPAKPADDEPAEAATAPAALASAVGALVSEPAPGTTSEDTAPVSDKTTVEQPENEAADEPAAIVSEESHVKDDASSAHEDGSTNTANEEQPSFIQAPVATIMQAVEQLIPSSDYVPIAEGSRTAEDESAEAPAAPADKVDDVEKVDETDERPVVPTLTIDGKPDEGDEVKESSVAPAEQARPASPWTPSYSVMNQGPNTPGKEAQPTQPDDDEEEFIPPPHLPSLKRSMSTSSLNVSVTPAGDDDEGRPRSPWTPSYSVTNQKPTDEPTAEVNPIEAALSPEIPKIADEGIAAIVAETVNASAPEAPQVADEGIAAIVADVGSASTVADDSTYVATAAPAIVVDDDQEASIEASAQEITATDRPASRPWTPSYSVTSQGPADQADNVESEPAAGVQAETEQSLQNDHPFTASALETPNESERPASRPWTPSYSVMRQEPGVEAPAPQELQEEKETDPLEFSAAVAAFAVDALATPAADVERPAERPWTPSYSVTKQDPSSVDPAVEEVEDSSLAQVASEPVSEATASALAAPSATEDRPPSRPWTPSYSVTQQAPGDVANPSDKANITNEEEETKPSKISAAVADFSAFATGALATPAADADRSPSRPWTPSYSVTKQDPSSAAPTTESAADSTEALAPVEALVLSAADTDRPPSRPWTPSYSVTKQDPSSPAPAAEAVDESIPEQTLATPAADIERPPSRPWTPSYSVTKQDPSSPVPVVEQAEEPTVVEALSTSTNDADRPPSRPWTPSYSVTKQDPSSPAPVLEKAEEPIPVEDLSAPVVDANRSPSRPWTPSYSVTKQDPSSPTPAVVDLEDASSAQALHEDASQPIIPTLVTPADQERPASRPWTPSYSVMKQVPAEANDGSANEVAVERDVESTSPAPEIHVNDKPEPVPEPAQETERPKSPWTPSYSVTDQPGSPRATTKDLEPEEPELERPKSPWTPSYSVTDQPGSPRAKANDVEPELAAVAEPAPVADVTEALSSEDPPQRPWTPSYSVHAQGPSTPKEETKPSDEPALNSAGVPETFPATQAKPELTPLAAVDLSDNASTRTRKSSVSSSRFFPGGWFHSAPNTPNVEEAGPVNTPMTGVEEEEDKPESKSRCLIM